MMGKVEIRSPPGSRPRDGRHCDLCGCSQPAVRCDKCGCQIFCLSCDDMYHRHPKRRFHLRKAVDTIPPVPQARPVLPMKVSHLNATNPGDPSKMPLPPPRKKKSLFSSFRKPSPSSEHSPPLPKKEYSWTDRLGSIKKFMSNRPLPPLPTSDDNDGDSPPATNGQVQRGDLSFIHKRSDEKPPQLPERSPRSPDFPGMNQEKENRIPSIPPHLSGQVRNGTMEPNANHMNQNHEFNSNDPNQWNTPTNHQNGSQAFGTLNRQRPFMPPGAPGFPGGMHQSSSATDLHNLHNAEGQHGPVPPHYPHYPVNPHMPPHYPYPMYPGYPNYPQYFGNSFANLSNPPTSEGDFSDSESSSRHSSKRHAFRKRAKRSQSVMVDRMAYPGQFFPFGPYPGYGPWGAPMPIETPPSPASSVRSLNRTGRTRRRKKGTSEDDDEELSETSSPMSRPKSSSSDPKETPRAPLGTQTTSSEEESDDDGDKRKNKSSTIRRQSDPVRSPSPVVNKKVAKLKKSSSKQSDSDTQESSAAKNDRRPSDSTTDQLQPLRQSSSQKQHNFKRSPTPQKHKLRELSPAQTRASESTSSTQQQINFQRSPTPQQSKMKESPAPQSTSTQPQTSATSETWECRHCTFINPIGNRICQVCCKTATPRTETPVSSPSRASSSLAKNRKDSVGSENEYFVPEETNENEANKKEKQEMDNLNSALDEAEKQISKGLEELMKLKDDIDSNTSKEKSKTSENEEKPVYKSSGRMRTSILDKLNLNKSQTTNSSVSTSTETQTDQNSRTIDKIIEARRLSNSSTASETYNSPLAQSPELERGYTNKQKRDSSCQTQQDSIAEYLEKRKAAEEAFLGRPINNFGFGYGDRMDLMTSPVPSMYDRFYGGGFGMMQRSHSRASLFTGRMNDFGPMEYGPGPGFGYGPAPMYRSVSRGSLTGDYPDGRRSGFHNLAKPDYYLSMEELVERRCQDNINSIRAQGLELVRMIREAEQQGFNADDIQVALTHCGKQNPLEWLQENWRNMVDSVVTLSTNYGNDKKENDIGMLSENEARDALRLHKGNIWAAVTECVEGRQRKYLELSARGKFSRQDIVDALASSEGDVEMAYAKLTKSTGKPFLMRIWGQGEGAQNQDGAQPMIDDFHDGRRRYGKDDTLNNEYLSDEIWSEDEDADWDEEDDYEEERGDIEDLRTCQEDLPSNPQEMMTPESEKSDYCDAFSIDDRNVSSPSDDVFFVIPEAKPEKKKGFLSKLVALRRDSKERAENVGKEEVSLQKDNNEMEDSATKNVTASSDQKNGGALNTLKNKISAIKDTVTGVAKNEKKLPSAQVERRTIIVRGQLEHESLSTNDEIKSTPSQNSTDAQNKEQVKLIDELSAREISKSTKIDNIKVPNQNENNEIKTDKINVENVSEESHSKKSESKTSQSLAERLKFAKQTHSSNDAPGPSGIDKSALMQLSAKKDESPVKTTKENLLQESPKTNSNIIPGKNDTLYKTNIENIPNAQNSQGNRKSKLENINVDQNNKHVPENIKNVKTVTSSNIQSPEKLQPEKVPTQELSKESKTTSAATSPKPETSTEKSSNLKISETKKAIALDVRPAQVSNKEPTVVNKAQVNSETALSSKQEQAKLIESKPSSDLKTNKNENNQNNAFEASNNDSLSTVNSSMSATDAETTSKTEKTPSDLKTINSQNEKAESKTIQLKEFSGKASEAISEIKDVTENNKIYTHKNEDPNANSEKQNLVQEDNKALQQPENQTDNVKKTKTVRANLNNSKSAGSQNNLEKSQKLLQENNKTETIVSKKEETLAIHDTLNSEPTQISVNTGNDLSTKTENNLKTNDIQKENSSGEAVKQSETHDRNVVEENLNSKPGTSSSQKDDISTKSEAVVTKFDDSKNLKETYRSEIQNRDMQNNLIKLETLSENKLIDPESTKSSNLPSMSVNFTTENLPVHVNLENATEQSKVQDDNSKEKIIFEETSSKELISNQLNVVENIEITNEQNSYEHKESSTEISQKATEAAENKDTDISSQQNREATSDNSQSLMRTKDNENDTSITIPESNEKLMTNTESGISEQNLEENNSTSAILSGLATDLKSSTSSLPTLVQPNKNKPDVEDSTLGNNLEINKNTSEQSTNELRLNKTKSDETETISITNLNENSESDQKNSEVKKVVPGENDKNITNNNIPIQAQFASSEDTQNASVSDKNQNKLSHDITPTTSEVKDMQSNVAAQVIDQQAPEPSAPEPSKSTNLNSSNIINKEATNETKLEAPVFSKEFPSKSSADYPESLSNNNEITIAPDISDSKSVSTISHTDISDILKTNEKASTINTSDSHKTLKPDLSINELENDSSSDKTILNNKEAVVNNEFVPSSSKTTGEQAIEDKAKTSDTSKTEQKVSDNASKFETSASVAGAGTANNSIKEVSSKSETSVAITSNSSNTTDSSETVTTHSDPSTSDNKKPEENSISELSAASISDVKDQQVPESSDAKTSLSKSSEQHSKALETIAASNSTTTRNIDSSSTNSVSSIQNKKFQRTVSEDKKEATSSESEDTDTEYSGYSGYSDNSRRGSLILPSPVDTLRSRFEGLASGATIRGGPIRPASPFRRMSFNSRKQVIALERKRDTSAEKPWYHKVDPEPVKIVQPKRSVKQQLEMERKVRKMVADRKCRTYKKAEIVVQLMDMNFEEEEAIQAANECSTLEQAISYLQQECLLCAGHFPVSQIVSMTHCEHRACRECIRAYFTVQIRDRTILELLCPFCNEPDIGDEDVAQDYFNHLDIMLKKLVDTEIHELFQRKLRDRVLMKDPNFRWCSQCSSGFIAMPNLKRLICPDCNAVTCASCRRLWEKEHQGISCEAFAALKDASDPEAQAAGLAKMLTEDGISCPSCHFRYALAKGGCMHFRCIQCQHDFCSGCSRPFKMGQKCGVSEFCAKLGLHAHHPRNCLFYLRDKEPEDLQKLLDMSDVKYNREPPEGMEVTTTCQVMEQKETADGMVDDYCGKDVQEGYAGLCRLHYVEYLGQLVNKYKVDPIQIFDNDDLELVLKRANIRLPPKRYRENDAQYREKLIKVIQEELPLDRMDGS